jgi:hypothetical protein
VGGGGGEALAGPPGNVERYLLNLHRLVRSGGASDGWFGEPGRGRYVRVITSSDPVATARQFYETAAFGGVANDTKGGAVRRTFFSDDSHVVFRESSSDGSPAVEIHVKRPGTGFPDYQKIHFRKG